MLSVHAGAYPVEAGNPRHEHEWASGRTLRFRTTSFSFPVLSATRPLVEHPQVVADRIVRYAKVVGRENVIAGTDCGFGGASSADRMGEARGAGGRRQARDRGALALGDGPIKGTQPPLIPVQAGIQRLTANSWVPAFAGTSEMRGADPSRSDLLQSKYCCYRAARASAP